jgi:hypothetical protein
MLTDNSAAEQAAVRKAFRGLLDGETEVTHLLCRVHSMRMLDQQLKKHKSSHDHLLTTLKYRHTSIGCDESIELALHAALDNTTKEYIRKEWKNIKEL